jgi:lysozyme
MAVLAVLILGGAALVLLLKAEGVDVGSTISDVVEQVTSAASDIPAELGLTNDPIALATPIIKNFESCSLKAYPDPPGSGKFSIGWGHQIKSGESYDQNSVISQSEADDLLRVDVGSAYTCVTQNVETDLTLNQTAALISFCYNVGCTAFSSSTLVSLVNQGDFEGASEQFSSWIHAGGLVSQELVDRRSQEQELFNS